MPLLVERSVWFQKKNGRESTLLEDEEKRMFPHVPWRGYSKATRLLEVKFGALLFKVMTDFLKKKLQRHPPKFPSYKSMLG